MVRAEPSWLAAIGPWPQVNGNIWREVDQVDRVEVTLTILDRWRQHAASDLTGQFVLDLPVGNRTRRGAAGAYRRVDGHLLEERSRADGLVATWRRPTTEAVQTNGTILGQQAKVIAAGNVSKELVQPVRRSTVHKISPQDFDDLDIRQRRSRFGRKSNDWELQQDGLKSVQS